MAASAPGKVATETIFPDRGARVALIVLVAIDARCTARADIFRATSRHA
jgi:hypothetical protein